MHTQEHLQQGSGFMGALTRQILLPSHKSTASFHGSYASVPRRDVNWSVRSESPKYIGDHLVVPDGSRKVIQQRYEYRMNKDSLDLQTGQNWRLPQQDRSVTLHEMSARGRPVYRPKLPGLKTADLSHRLRHSPRGNKKPIFINQSSPRPFPTQSQRVEKKLPAKDRLTLPTHTTHVEKKSEQRINRKGISISKLKNKTEVHVKSSTLNDPRIRPTCSQNIPNEPIIASIDKYIGSVRNSLSPIKSPIKSPILTPKYFDEVTSLKETKSQIQETFDVPLPPPLISPKSNQINNNLSGGITKDSFWDETDDCMPEINPIQFTPNIQDTFPPEVNSHPTETPSTNPSQLILSESCNQAVNSSFFDDEISSNANQPTNSLNLTKLYKKQTNPHSNAIKQRRRDEKLKKYTRKELSNEEKKLHSKRPHIKSNSPHPQSHNKPSKSNVHRVLPSNSNSPIIKLNTQTHIRLKKTVNIADQESEHSSSEDETSIHIPAVNNIYIPLPTSPLQPLQIEPTNNTPLKLQSSDISNDFSGQIDFTSIESQDISNLCTRDDTGIGLAVEVQGTPFINNITNKPTHTKDIIEILEQRQSMISESSEIGLQIEYVSDDVISKSPVGCNIELSTETQKINELPSLLIQNFKPVSPKCEIETPDSVFTPGFSCSQLPQTFSIESIDSLIQSLDSSVVESEGLNSAGRDTDKYKSAKRKSTRKSKLFKPNIDSLTRTDSDLSFNSTREVCIPLTKLNVRQYGAKARPSPQGNLSGKQIRNSKYVPRCMLCQRAANESNLGFLYGPYHKRGDSLSSAPANRIATKEFDKNEMWVHAPCALCSPGVLLVSFQIDGLANAYDTSKHSRCEECGNTGATLSCQTDSCTRVYHYACANNCSLNESFQLLCPRHSTDTAKDF